MIEDYCRDDGCIALGNARILFPVDELAATVDLGADAVTRLRDADRILVVGPRSLGSSYFLGHHRLAAIEIDTLPAGVRMELVAAELDLEEYDVIRIGKLGGSHTASM